MAQAVRLETGPRSAVDVKTGGRAGADEVTKGCPTAAREASQSASNAGPSIVAQLDHTGQEASARALSLPAARRCDEAIDNVHVSTEILKVCYNPSRDLRLLTDQSSRSRLPHQASQGEGGA